MERHIWLKTYPLKMWEYQRPQLRRVWTRNPRKDRRDEDKEPPPLLRLLLKQNDEWIYMIIVVNLQWDRTMDNLNVYAHSSVKTGKGNKSYRNKRWWNKVKKKKKKKRKENNQYDEAGLSKESWLFNVKTEMTPYLRLQRRWRRTSKLLLPPRVQLGWNLWRVGSWIENQPQEGECLCIKMRKV